MWTGHENRWLLGQIQVHVEYDTRVYNIIDTYLLSPSSYVNVIFIFFYYTVGCTDPSGRL